MFLHDWALRMVWSRSMFHESQLSFARRVFQLVLRVVSRPAHDDHLALLYLGAALGRRNIGRSLADDHLSLAFRIHFDAINAVPLTGRMATFAVSISTVGVAALEN